MSVAASKWAWEQRLPTGEKIVLLALADLADEHGCCYPGIEYLADATGRGKRSVIRDLDGLAGRMLARRLARTRDPSGKYDIEPFQLAVPPGSLRSRHRKGTGAKPGAMVAPGPGAMVAPGPGAKPGAMVAPNPSSPSGKILTRAREAASVGGAPPRALPASTPGQPHAAPGCPTGGEAHQAGLPLTPGQRAGLEEVLGKGAAASWFGDCRFEAETRTLIAPTRFFRDYIDNQFGHKLAGVFGGKVKVVEAR